MLVGSFQRKSANNSGYCFRFVNHKLLSQLQLEQVEVVVERAEASEEPGVEEIEQNVGRLQHVSYFQKL